MGIFFSRVFSNLFGPKEVRILILGLDNAGKTTVLRTSFMNSLTGMLCRWCCVVLCWVVVQLHINEVGFWPLSHKQRYCSPRYAVHSWVTDSNLHLLSLFSPFSLFSCSLYPDPSYYVCLPSFFVTFLFVSLNPFGLSFVSCNEQISFKMMGKLSRPHLPLGSMWRCCNTGTLSSRSGILVDRQLFALIGDATTRILTQSFLLLTVVT